jgi:hypothetical protein
MMAGVDQAVIDRANAFIEAAGGCVASALVLAVATDMHRAFHRLPPLEKTTWTPEPIREPLDVATSPNEASPL